MVDQGLKLSKTLAYFCSMLTTAPDRCSHVHTMVRWGAFLLCVLFGSSAHGQFYRKLEYFVENDTYLHSFSPTTDGGMLLVGAHSTSEANEWHVVKTNALGVVEWAKRYGPTTAYLEPVAMPLAGGGHLLVGKLFYSAAIWTSLLRIHDDGTLVSQRAIGRPGYVPMAFRPITLSNGDLLIVDFAFQGFAFTRLSPSGDVLWSNTRSMGSTMSWVDISDPRAHAYETPEGDIVACGAVVAYNATMDALVMKVNADGHLLWHRTFGAVGADGFRWVLPTSDGGVLAYGTLNNVSNGQLLVVRLAADGAVLWQKAIGGDQIYNSVFLLPLPNGRYLLGARVAWSGAQPPRPLIFEMSEDGVLLWAEEYAADELLKDARITPDGIDMLALKFMPGGSFNSILRKFSDIKEHCEEVLSHSLTVTDVVMETTQPLILSAGKTLSEPALTHETMEVPFEELCFQSAVPGSSVRQEPLSVFPNPVIGHCALNGIDGKRVEQLLLYDAQGRFVADFTKQAHGRLDLRSLASGPYALRVAFTSGERQVVRFLVGG